MYHIKCHVYLLPMVLTPFLYIKEADNYKNFDTESIQFDIIILKTTEMSVSFVAPIA